MSSDKVAAIQVAAQVSILCDTQPKGPMLYATKKKKRPLIALQL
jgi:hypothetical protein